MERFINKLLDRNLCFIGKADEVEEVINEMLSEISKIIRSRSKNHSLEALAKF